MSLLRPSKNNLPRSKNLFLGHVSGAAALEAIRAYVMVIKKNCFSGETVGVHAQVVLAQCIYVSCLK